MRYFNTGNEIVDQVGEMNIVGDMVPLVWLSKICDENGKSNLLAILLLANIVFWYRPRQVRDEMSGALIRWEKRFADDLLQNNYADLATTFRQNKKAIQRALKLLEDIGVIQRHFRTVKMEKKPDLQNVMYIELKPDILREITFPEDTSDSEDDFQRILNERYLSGKARTLHSGTESVFGNDDFVHRYGHQCPEVWTEKEGKSPENAEKSRKIAINRTDFVQGYGHQCPEGTPVLSIPPSQNVHTYTEKSMYTISGNNNPSIYQSNDRVMDRDKEAEACISLIKENICYDHHMQFDDRVDRELYRDLFNVMANTLRDQSEQIRIGKNQYSYTTVKKRFLQITEDHMLYVIECMKKTTTRVGNVKQYMLVSLFNSVDTMDTYYMKEVQQDMPWIYDPGWQSTGKKLPEAE